MTYAALKQGGFLGPNGWPFAMSVGVIGLTASVLTDLRGGAAGVAGRYILGCGGNGTQEMEGRAQIVDPAPGRLVFDYIHGTRAVSLALTTARQDYHSAYASGALFNPVWLARIPCVRGPRFVDCLAITTTTLARLEDRPKLGDFRWPINGVPIKVTLAPANDMREDAPRTRDTFAPGLVAQVEYANKVWNWQPSQAAWADTHCRVRWSSCDCWVQFYILHAAKVADIWAGAFGAKPDCLTRVIAIKTSWIGLKDHISGALLAVGEGREPRVYGFDADAITGYFAAGLGRDAKANDLQDWLRDGRRFAAAQAPRDDLTGTERDRFIADHRFDKATHCAAAALENGAVTGKIVDRSVALLTTVLRHHAAVACAAGLDLGMYKEGRHVVVTGDLLEDTKVTAFFYYLNYSPQMGLLYDRLLNGWATQTPARFNAFAGVSVPNKGKSWGGMRHLGDDNPHWQALANGCSAC
jgi:hypothetical protein